MNNKEQLYRMMNGWNLGVIMGAILVASPNWWCWILGWPGFLLSLWVGASLEDDLEAAISNHHAEGTKNKNIEINMEKGKITFEPSVPPSVKPLYQYHDHMRDQVVIVGETMRGGGITYLTYDGVSNMPILINEVPLSQFKIL